MSRGIRRLSAVLLAGAVALGACSPSGEQKPDLPPEPERPANTQYFGYQVDIPLVTTNAATAVGKSTDAHQLAGRLYPPVYVQGPSGEMIPNTDLITARPLPGVQRQVMYTLTPEARYSDGEPVVCDDYMLSFIAHQLDSIFDSRQPLLDQVERIDCTPGSKEFTVVFLEGQGDRWRHLFPEGTVLPSHAIAREAGMTADELTAALQAQDVVALEKVAEVWNTGFNLADFNPDLQVSSGPFVISEVGEKGEVVLRRNEHYYGDEAALDTVVVWPETADTHELIEHDALRIVAGDSAHPDWLSLTDPNQPFVLESRVGDLTEALRLSPTGILGQPWARQAFSACVDQHWVAAASADISGIDVYPVATQVIPHWDPMAQHLADISWPNAEVNHAAASSLAGTTIRIGYQGPDERKAAIVQILADSCADAGITVVDASAEGSTTGDLGRVRTGPWGEQIYEEGSIDA